MVAEALSVYRVDPVLLDRLAPTHIITQTQCEVCAVSLSDVQRAVRELVQSRPRVVSLEPMHLGDVWRDIHTVAAALGAAERGHRLVDTLTARLDAIRAHTQALGKRPVIACVEWIDPLMHAENWIPELVRIAGGTSMIGEPGRHSGYSSMDELVRHDPDLIAIMPCGFDIERSRREMPPLVYASRLDEAVRRPHRTRLCDRRQPILQPTRSAHRGVGGDLAETAPSGSDRLRSSRHRLGALERRDALTPIRGPSAHVQAIPSPRRSNLAMYGPLEGGRPALHRAARRVS